MSARERDHRVTIHSCGVCGRVFSAKARVSRDIAAGRRDALCDAHREQQRVCPDEPIEQTVEWVPWAHRHFWLQRFSLGEIVEMAEMIWGPRHTWEPDWAVWFEFERQPPPPRRVA